MSSSLEANTLSIEDAKKKSIFGYCMYDWGKSAFETSVTVAILPAWFAILFMEANGLTVSTPLGLVEGDALWSFCVGIGVLMVALVSPSFGVIADRRKVKKRWLKILTYVGAGATFLLAAAPFIPISSQWLWLMVMFVLANIGLNGAGVFYNALLPHMGPDDEMDSISNKAFAYGYLGGGILLVLHLGILMKFDYATWTMQFAMASSGIWWYGFALLTFKLVPEPPIENEMEVIGFKESAKLALSEVKNTLQEHRKFRTLFLYMLAYFFFIDGINSVTSLGGIFGVTVLGITTFDLIITIVAIQFVAAPAAIGFTFLADKIGTKKALSISLGAWVVLCFAALSFAPLALDQHDEFDVRFTWSDEHDAYAVNASSSSELAQKLEYSDDEFNEQAWASQWEYLLPLEVNEKIEQGRALKWLAGDDNGMAEVMLVGVNNSNITLFLDSIEGSRFSSSVEGGDITNSTAVGTDHPTNLGDGLLDAIPVWVRGNVWGPLGIAVGIQFLLLGCAMGLLLGGSQGLARSLFGQMVPETRSAEFFGFFGFFGKVAAFIGPFLYTLMTILFDSRVGILSISVLILIGAVMMLWVDVEDGITVATAEDARNRSLMESE